MTRCYRGCVVRRGGLGVIAAVTAVLVLAGPVGASIAHSRLVSPTPAAFTPKVVLGTSGQTVYALAQVGTTMFAGGRFAQNPRCQRDHDVLPSQLRRVRRHDRGRPAALAAGRWRRAGHRAVTGRARHLHRRRLPFHRWDRSTGDRALRPHDQRARPSLPARPRRRGHRRRVRRVEADHRRSVHASACERSTPPAAPTRATST